jgi:hypothetical protein
MFNEIIDDILKHFATYNTSTLKVHYMNKNIAFNDTSLNKWIKINVDFVSSKRDSLGSHCPYLVKGLVYINLVTKLQADTEIITAGNLISNIFTEQTTINGVIFGVTEQVKNLYENGYYYTVFNIPFTKFTKL